MSTVIQVVTIHDVLHVYLHSQIRIPITIPIPFLYWTVGFEIKYDSAQHEKFYILQSSPLVACNRNPDPETEAITAEGFFFYHRDQIHDGNTSSFAVHMRLSVVRPSILNISHNKIINNLLCCLFYPSC